MSVRISCQTSPKNAGAVGLRRGSSDEVWRYNQPLSRPAELISGYLASLYIIQFFAGISNSKCKRALICRLDPAHFHSAAKNGSAHSPERSQKRRNPAKLLASALFMAFLPGFEPGTFRLGVWFVQYPVLHHSVIQCQKTL